MGDRFRKHTIGKRVFGEKCEVTDPCYDSDGMFRMNVKIVAGEYSCVAWTYKEHKRIGAIGIYLNGDIPKQKSMEEIGMVGVDAGLAGFFENKPNYTDEEWGEFCRRIYSTPKQAWIFSEGFFSESGYGDGVYPVYAYKNNNSGQITALEIRFI